MQEDSDNRLNTKINEEMHQFLTDSFSKKSSLKKSALQNPDFRKLSFKTKRITKWSPKNIDSIPRMIEYRIDTSDYDASSTTYSSLAPLANANRRSTGTLVNAPNPVEQRFLALYRRYISFKNVGPTTSIRRFSE